MPGPDREISFSVVMPLYNKVKSVGSAVGSVLAQTFMEFELIIINDGSTDGSPEVVSTFNDPRIRVINQENRGVSNARNCGIRESRFRYVAFLDADDLWYPDALSTYRKLINSFEEARVFYTGHRITGAGSTGTGRSYYTNDLAKANAVAMAKYTHLAFSTGSVVVAKECFDAVGLFNEEMPYAEDRDMWDRLSQKFLFAGTEVVTMEYRISAENRISRQDCTINRPDLIAVSERSMFNTRSEKLFHGCQCFFRIVNNIRNRKKLKESLRLFFRFGDWVLLFTLCLVRYRAFRFR